MDFAVICLDELISIERYIIRSDLSMSVKQRQNYYKNMNKTPTSERFPSI